MGGEEAVNGAALLDPMLGGMTDLGARVGDLVEGGGNVHLGQFHSPSGTSVMGGLRQNM
jgi:hypothetical protein